MGPIVGGLGPYTVQESNKKFPELAEGLTFLKGMDFSQGLSGLRNSYILFRSCPIVCSDEKRALEAD